MSEEWGHNVITLDDALNKFEVSWFHYRLLLICGTAFMADSMEVSLLSFISQCAGSEWDLSNSEIASITSTSMYSVYLHQKYY